MQNRLDLILHPSPTEVRMDVHLGQELLDELGSSLETLETQQGALLQLLKDKGIVTDEELAPYLTQAGNASNVRWRAARLRLERLLSAAQEKEEETRKRQKDQDTAAQTQPEKSERAESAEKASTKAEDDKAKSREKNPESVEPSTAKTEAKIEENAKRSKEEAKSSPDAKPAPKDRDEQAA
jgi:hypothetical protein